MNAFARVSKRQTKSRGNWLKKKRMLFRKQRRLQLKLKLKRPSSLRKR